MDYSNPALNRDWYSEFLQSQSTPEVQYIKSEERIVPNSGGVTIGEHITDMYQNLLGRTPDQEGYQQWLNKAQGLLDQGGTADLQDAFVASLSENPADQAYYDVAKDMPYANGLSRQTAAEAAQYYNRAAEERRNMNDAPGVYNPLQNTLTNNTADQQQAALQGFKDYWAKVGNLSDEAAQQVAVDTLIEYDD